MMNVIFAGMVLFSFACALLLGRMDALSTALLEKSAQAVTLVISMTGMLCFWSGLMKVAQASGLTRCISRLLAPVTKRLFPSLPPNSAAMQAVCLNLSANLLGLGNAATPFGIRAVCEMQRMQRANGCATNEMVMFVVLNTASLQLIPTTTALLRMRAGAATPLDILPAVWLASIGSIVVGVLMAKCLQRRA